MGHLRWCNILTEHWSISYKPAIRVIHDVKCILELTFMENAIYDGSLLIISSPLMTLISVSWAKIILSWEGSIGVPLGLLKCCRMNPGHR